MVVLWEYSGSRRVSVTRVGSKYVHVGARVFDKKTGAEKGGFGAHMLTLEQHAERRTRGELGQLLREATDKLRELPLESVHVLLDALKGALDPGAPQAATAPKEAST